MIAALYVVEDGPYSNLPEVECWGESKDARLYKGPHPVIAHPPCERWGRYWGGGPSARVKRIKGDDGRCFSFALACVRLFSGILEHPEASHAWVTYGLTKPPKTGGWVKADNYGGLTCCVEQGHYGHSARKATWLYIHGVLPVELIWGEAPGMRRLDEGFHSSEERRRQREAGVKPCERLSKRQRKVTPTQFRDKLISMVKGLSQ